MQCVRGLETYYPSFEFQSGNKRVKCDIANSEVSKAHMGRMETQMCVEQAAC
jgi:hypothetical protein